MKVEDTEKYLIEIVSMKTTDFKYKYFLYIQNVTHWNNIG